VNPTTSGAVPDVGLALDVAVSAGLTVIDAVVAEAFRPAASVTVRVA
jgi:hypothetical protein